MPQHLIEPVVCRFGSEDTAILLENAQLLENLGFEAEDFGGDCLVFRQIPESIEIIDVEPVISEICSALKLGGEGGLPRLDKIYNSIACKASIKAGKSSAPEELGALAAKVLSGEITHCPHGRPLTFELSKSALDKSFKRS